MNNPRLLVIFTLLVVSLASLQAQSPQVTAYNQARQLQNQGNYFAALEAYTELVRQYPTYADPVVGLAESFFMLGEYKDALTYVEQALRLRRGDTSLQVLHGRILVGAGSFDKARTIFQDILSREPHNTEALLGYAELNVAEGNVGDALQTYTDTLKFVPDNRRALLGLLLLSDELERFEASETYVAAAMRYHGDSPRVQVAVARHYMKRGRFEDALYHARLAISLKPDYTPALLAAARAYLLQGQYQDAVPYLTDALKVEPGDPETLYTLGTAYARTGKTEEAVKSYTAVFRERRDDELSRYALESLVKQKEPEDYPLRKTLADYHVKRGEEYQGRFLLDKALGEYRLAVQLLPSVAEYRLKYAQVYKILGFPAKYLSELEVMAAEGPVSDAVQDELEIQRSLQESGIARTWNVPQFSIDRAEYSIGVFLDPDDSRMVHFAGQEVAGGLLVNFLGGQERIAVPGRSYTPVSSYSEAFRQSRARGDDYFLMLSFDETPRSFTVRSDLYLADNGALIRQFKAFRTGNDRVSDSINRVVGDLQNALPLKAVLVRREFDKGLMNLGRIDGLKGDEEFLILPPGEVSLRRDSLGFDYSEDKIVGSFTVSAMDELVTDGSIKTKGFFDYINEGDTLILPTEDPPRKAGNDTQQSGLYQELLTIQ